MIQWRAATCLEVLHRWPGAVVVSARLEAVEAATPDGAPAEDSPEVRALAYTDLLGTPEPGQRLLLNTTALALGLGTGGLAIVVAIPDALMADHPDHPPRTPGHVVKARYTPSQTTVLGVDEQDSPHHAILRDADNLGGMPVVVADLHSALPAVLAGARAWDDGLRAAYVMTDGGALAMPFSRSVAALRSAGWLVGTVSTGQAYGADLEAVTVHTGLLAAKHVLAADLAVVAQGPGNLGTGTRWGFSGVSVGDVINATGTLRGRAVAALRVSQADPRARHVGVSHHSLTALGRVALLPADVVVPEIAGDLGVTVSEQLAAMLKETQSRGTGAAHRLVSITRPQTERLMAALADVPVTLSTMGRGLSEDPAAFLASAAAGWHAAQLAT